MTCWINLYSFSMKCFSITLKVTWSWKKCLWFPEHMKSTWWTTERWYRNGSPSNPRSPCSNGFPKGCPRLPRPLLLRSEGCPCSSIQRQSRIRTQKQLIERIPCRRISDWRRGLWRWNPRQCHHKCPDGRIPHAKALNRLRWRDRLTSEPRTILLQWSRFS